MAIWVVNGYMAMAETLVVMIRVVMMVVTMSVMVVRMPVLLTVMVSAGMRRTG